VFCLISPNADHYFYFESENRRNGETEKRTMGNIFRHSHFHVPAFQPFSRGRKHDGETAGDVPME